VNATASIEALYTKHHLYYTPFFLHLWGGIHTEMWTTMNPTFYLSIHYKVVDNSCGCNQFTTNKASQGACQVTFVSGSVPTYFVGRWSFV